MLGFYNFHLLEKEVKKIWEIKVRRIRIRKQNKHKKRRKKGSKKEKTRKTIVETLFVTKL
jgi:ribosomal protein L23